MRLVRAMAPEPPKHEHVDVDGRLVELGLSVHLPSVVWPEMAAIRELSTKIKALGKTGQECVFVAVDLRKYVWNFAVACWMAVTVFIQGSFQAHGQTTCQSIWRQAVKPRRVAEKAVLGSGALTLQRGCLLGTGSVLCTLFLGLVLLWHYAEVHSGSSCLGATDLCRVPVAQGHSYGSRGERDERR